MFSLIFKIIKNVLHILASFVLLINYSCKAQQLLQTTADVQELKTNEQQFINKPLEYLLKEKIGIAGLELYKTAPDGTIEKKSLDVSKTVIQTPCNS